MATIVVAAVTVLAVEHILTGGEALSVIAAAGGFTLGGTIGSASNGVSDTGSAPISRSASTGTATVSTLAPITANGDTTPTMKAE